MSASPGPPRFWERVLSFVVRRLDREAALGDLSEEHEIRRRRGGDRSADRWYRRQVLRSVPTALTSRISSSPPPPGDPLGDRFRAFWSARFQDVRWTFRTVRRNPGFAAVVLLTLGLGIGSATAVFTVVEGVLLRPLPYPESERLVRVGQDGEEGAFWFSLPNFEDVRTSLESLEDLAAWAPTGMNVVVDGEPARLQGAEVTANFFATLGVEPQLGRAFAEAEEAAAATVVVVSNEFWLTRMGGRPDAVGQTVLLDGAAHEVVGVLPLTPMIPEGSDVWLPLRRLGDQSRQNRGIMWLQSVGRLRTDVDVEAASAEADILEVALREAYPEPNERLDLAVRSLDEMTVDSVRDELGIIMAAGVLLLLVAAVNVGGLLLARATARSGEVWVRGALGGGRGRLGAQLLTEAVILGALGALAGAFMGRIGVTALLAWGPATTPRWSEVSMGGTALLFAFCGAALAVLVFAPGQALSAVRGATPGLHDPRSEKRAGTRLRDGMVVLQIALALALVTSAGLLGKSLRRQAQVDPGFRASGVLVVGLPVVEADFPTDNERAEYHLGILDRVSALPGVQAAGLTNAVPFVSWGPFFDYRLPDIDVDPSEQLLSRYRVVTPGLFEALGVPILAGRPLVASDAQVEAERVAVVSEELASRHFASGDPTGQLIETAGETWRIVGVAGAIRDGYLTAPSPAPHVYVPLRSETSQSFVLVLRSAGDPEELLPSLRAAVGEIAPAQPLLPALSLEQVLSDVLAGPRFVLGLLVFFAAATLLLAAVGLYGLLAFNVGRRTREIGLRVALGAPAGRVRRLVVFQGLRLGGAGLVLGLGLAVLGGRLLESQLFGVGRTDPGVIAATALGLLILVATAAWIPARRATATQPRSALSAE